MKDTITQADIDSIGNDFALVNYAGGIDGVAVSGAINKIVDGELATIRVVCEIRRGEEIDDEAIYTVDRVISADIVDYPRS